MKSSSETSAQRAERLAAEKARSDIQAIQDREQEEEAAQTAVETKKKLEAAKRARGMQGGGREGLMYKGSNVGVQK